MGINEWVSRVCSATILPFLLVTLLLSSCEQQVEGCLDFRAVSVDFGADDPCADCCEYPSLQLQLVPVRFEVDTLRLLSSLDTLVSDTLAGRVPQLAFYLHNIRLIAENGDQVLMQDTFTVFASGDNPTFLFESSVVRASPLRQTSYTIGTLLEENTFVAIEASLGLPDVLSVANEELQPSGSPLFRNSDTLLLSTADNSYLDAAFKFEELNGARDSFLLVDAMDQTIRWDLPAPLAYEPSYNVLITIGLPVDQLLLLNSGTISGELFATQFLDQGQVLDVALSR